MRVIEGEKQGRNGWNEKRGEGMGEELGREWWKREKEGAAGRKRYSKDEGKKGDEKGSEQARRKGRWSYGNGKFERCATGGQKQGQRRTDVGVGGGKRERLRLYRDIREEERAETRKKETKEGQVADKRNGGEEKGRRAMEYGNKRKGEVRGKRTERRSEGCGERRGKEERDEMETRKYGSKGEDEMKGGGGGGGTIGRNKSKEEPKEEKKGTLTGTSGGSMSLLAGYIREWAALIISSSWDRIQKRRQQR